jgi:hypothetical protein
MNLASGYRYYEAATTTAASSRRYCAMFSRRTKRSIPNPEIIEAGALPNSQSPACATGGAVIEAACALGSRVSRLILHNARIIVAGEVGTFRTVGNCNALYQRGLKITRGFIHGEAGGSDVLQELRR